MREGNLPGVNPNKSELREKFYPLLENEKKKYPSSRERGPCERTRIDLRGIN